MIRFLLLCVLSLFPMFALAQAEEEPMAEPPQKLRVITSFSVLEDITRNIAGEAVELYSLVPAGQDVHDYYPSPEDITLMQQADLIILNGLGFEGWVERLVESSETKAKIIYASNSIKTLDGKFTDGQSADADPHAWLNAANAQIYTMNIRDGLSAADPTNRNQYMINAARYIAQLNQLHQWIQKEMAKVPPSKRKAVTPHSAFAYFSNAYGVTLVTPAGMGEGSLPSAGGVAQTVNFIRSQGIKTIFTENMGNDPLMFQIMADTGATDGGMLYSDTLSHGDGPAATYIDMMKYDVMQMTNAMLGHAQQPQSSTSAY